MCREDDLQLIQEIREEEARRFRRIERIKKLVEPIMGTRFTALQNDFDDCYIWNMYLTKTSPAKINLVDKNLRMYVEQGFGCCEDDAYGTIWYHLKDKHWVALEFNC